MTKTFEEELKDREAETFSHWDGCTISKKKFINYADVVNLSQGWVSPEEYEKLVKNCAVYVLECKNINRVNAQLTKENEDLKSQLQQQALPVVPECVDKWYKFHMNGTFSAVITAYAVDGADKAVIWLVQNGGMDLLCKMKLYGYTAEKPQLFRLKLKNATISNYYLWLNHATGKVFVDKKYLDWTNHDNVKNIFTEQEIAKISDGAFVNNKAFELVPVEDGE